MTIYDELVSVLSTEIGDDGARRLCDRLRNAYGGQRVYFPRFGSRPSTTQTQHMNIGQVQRTFGVSRRTAYRYKK